MRQGVKRILEIIDNASRSFEENFLDEVCFYGSISECVKGRK